MIILQYCNNKIIEQFYSLSKNGFVTDESNVRNISNKLGIKSKLSFIFGSADGNIDNQIDFSSAKNKKIPDSYRIIETIQVLSKKHCENLDNLDLNVLLKYSGEYKATRIFDEINKKFFIKVQFRHNSFFFEGSTSAENWQSSSMLNQLLIEKSITGTIIFNIISAKIKRNMSVQIISIFQEG